MQVRWRTPVVAATHRLMPLAEDAPAPAEVAADLLCNAPAPVALHTPSLVRGTDADLGSAPPEGGAEVVARRLAALGQELAAAQLVRCKRYQYCLCRVAG